MTDLGTNFFYYGDNLGVMRRYLPDAAVDLVYLDPSLRDESGNAAGSARRRR